MATLFVLLFLLSIIALIVGLIKPRLILHRENERLLKIGYRKVVGGMFTFLTIFFFILTGVTAPKVQKPIGTEQIPLREVLPSTLSPVTPPITLSPTTPAPILTSTSQGSQKTYDVVKVIDGDTVSVSIDGKVEVLRLIGIDTSETVDPRKPVECFGVEASNKAKSLLSGKKVSLESDASQGERDKYNRLLRYVFLEDETNFNLLMIKEGYAYEYTYNLPYKYQSEFKKAQKEAMESKAGMWGGCLSGTNRNPIRDASNRRTSACANASIFWRIPTTTLCVVRLRLR